MRSKFSKIVVTASITAILLLTSVPPTSRMVREQLNLLIGRMPPALDRSQDDANSSLSKRDAVVAASYPDDFEIQLAEAIRRGTQRQNALLSRSAIVTVGSDGIRNENVRALLTLRPRFDNRVELAADILRYLTSDDLMVDRSEEDLTVAEGTRAYASELRLQNERRRGTVVTKQALDAAADAAIRGETLDPQNAFFPTMLAFQNLVQHHDAKAFQELKIAARLPVWDDYSSAESRAASRLYSLANGGVEDGFSDFVNEEYAPFPHMSQIRSMARVTIALAIQRELAGDRESGFRIRQSIAHIGATMRATSKSAVGCFAGIAITSLSSVRPGGAALVDPKNKMTSAARQASGDAYYVAYLSRIGHPETATWYIAERGAAERVRMIVTVADNLTIDNSPIMAGRLNAAYLNLWWMLDVYLLETAIAVALVGLLAVLWARSRRVTVGLGLHRGVRCGFALVLLAPAGWYIASLYADGVGYEAPAVKAAFAECLILVAVIFVLKRRHTWREAATDGLVAAGTLAGLCIVACAVGCVGVGLITTAGLCNAPNCGGEAAIWKPNLDDGLLGSFTLILPCVVAIAYAIRGRRVRLPASVAIARGLRDSAPATVACMLIAYGLACVGTCVQDANVRSDVDCRVADEGKYSAAVTGSEWPGPVPYPSAKAQPPSGNK